VLDQRAFTDLEEAQRTAEEWLVTQRIRAAPSFGIPTLNALSTALAGQSVSPLAWSHAWGKDAPNAISARRPINLSLSLASHLKG